MNPIRYKQRICEDAEAIQALLRETRVGVVAIAGDEYPYAVPVNFVWQEGAVYFHGMGSGKKVSLLEQFPQVSFTVYQEFGTVTDPVPCKADTSYRSVMVFGRTERVTDLTEATRALQLLLEKYTPGFYPRSLAPAMVEKYRSAHDNKQVAVYRILPQHLTAKENVVEPEALFHSPPTQGERTP